MTNFTTPEEQMSTHTPGPWVYNPIDMEVHIDGDPDEVIAAVEDYYNDDGSLMAETHHNGNLIAAAPELLDACKMVDAAHDELTKAHDAEVEPEEKRRLIATAIGAQIIALEKCRAAIAKATGAQS